MSSPSPTVCAPWATEADLCSPCLEKVLDFDATLLADALLASSEVLYRLTFEQWPGCCPDTVRPCTRYATPDTRRSRIYDWQGRGFSPQWGQAWVGWWNGGLYCGCRDQYQCGCSFLSQIGLGETPITEITQVKIDGVVVDAARYRIDDYRWLVYVPDPTGADPRRGWPCCQRLDLPSTETDTFEVSYVVGTLPSRAGIRSAAVLGCEFALAWSPNGLGQCRLPSNVSALTRQQVTMRLNDPLALFDKGLTGIAEVDSWVQSVRLSRRERRAAVVIPERQRKKVRRITG